METNASLIKEYDSVNGLIVTKTTNTLVVCGDKRFTKSKLQKDGFSYMAKYSPNKNIDWTNKESVIEYYNSFIYWSFYISGSVKFETVLCEVKDGLINYNGEFYLPCPTPNKDNWNAKRLDVKDGICFAKIAKPHNNWYTNPNSQDITCNVFYVDSYIIIDEKYEIEINDMCIRPYEQYTSGISLSYNASYRGGLSIDVNVADICLMLQNYMFPKNCFLTTEFKNYLQYSEKIPFSSSQLVSDINDIIRFDERKYYISDDESYGEYTLYKIQMDKAYLSQINNVVKNYIKKFKGKKYLTSLEEINKNK